MKKLQIILLCGVMILSIIQLGGTARAQDGFGFNEVKYLTESTGVGARALGMGGAFLTLSNDYSGSYWNPAGLGLINRQEIFASLGNLDYKADATAFSATTSSSRTSTKLDALGYVYPVPTFRGSLVFSFGYYRAENYNKSVNISGFNTGLSASSYLFTEPAVGTDVSHSETLDESGQMSVYSAAGAIEVAKNMYAGLSLNYYRGKNDYTLDFSESDTEHLYEVFPNDFMEYQQLNQINSKTRAYDVKLGFLYSANKNLRLAGTITSPKTVRIEENFSFYDNVIFDNFDDDPQSDGGQSDYKVRLPFKFEVGFSFSVPNLLLAGGIEYVDWSQMEYKTEPPLEGVTTFDANESIRNSVEAAVVKRAGAEYLVTPLNLSVRAGYFIVPSPYKNAPSKSDKKYLTAGIGLLITPQLKLDITYLRGTWEMETLDSFVDETIFEKRYDNRTLASLSMRF